MDRSSIKKIMVRADGNPAIGMGHIMRSMSVMSVLKEWGWQCIYACSSPAPVEFIKKRGFEVIELSFPYREKTREEGRELLKIMEERGISKIFVDSYFAGNDYFSLLNAQVKVILINSAKERFDVSMLINENIACDKSFFAKLYQGTNTNLLLGKDYTPLRAEFLGVPYEAGQEVKNILLMTGGGDQYNFLGQFVLKMREKKKYGEISFLCVSGMANSHHKELSAAAQGLPNVRVVHGTDNMAGLMAGCDLAVSAGGTSVLELAAVGVPTVAFTVAEDQVEGIGYMDRLGFLVSAGSIASPGFWNRLFDQLDALLADSEKRRKMACEAKKQMDARGAARIAEKIADL